MTFEGEDMRGRNVVPIDKVKGHRTNAEKRARKEAEKALDTGHNMMEWPSTSDNLIAHKHFARIRRLLKAIGKNDALYESAINRYCVLLAEVADFEKTKASFLDSKKALEGEYHSGRRESEGGISASEFYKLLAKMQENVIRLDQQLQTKRRMLLDIERDSLMTIASALRSTTKKPAEPKADPDAQMFG
jgi:phage terminase small subunit